MRHHHFLLLVAALSAFVSCDPDPSAADYYIHVSGNTKDRPYSGQTVNINVTTDAPSWGYDLGEAADWVVVNSKEDKKLQIVVKSNPDYEPRSASLLFFAPEDTRTATDTLVLSQQAAPFVPKFSTTAPSSITFGEEGATYGYAVSTNLGSWGFRLTQSDSGRFSVSKVADSLYISCPVNTLDKDYSATLLVYAPDTAAYQKYTRISIAQDPADISYGETDLSAGGTANCYVLPHKGPYKFKATVCGNGKAVEGMGSLGTLSPASACLLWQSQKSMISDISLADGYVHFKAARLFGNAVIGVKNASGDIIWSWHIWFPREDVGALPVESGATMMNLNLGATTSDHTSVSSYGTLYQWGRKDPFPGAPIMRNGTVQTDPVVVYDINNSSVSIGYSGMTDMTLSANHLSYSIAHPTVCISANPQWSASKDWLKKGEGSDALWGNPDGEYRETNSLEYVNRGTKTCYDPCPPGWTVACLEDIRHITRSGGMAWASGTTDSLVWASITGAMDVYVADLDGDGVYSLDGDWKDGWYFWLKKDRSVKSYFPATTRYDAQYAQLMGSMVGLWGNYWTNVPDTDSEGMADALSFCIKTYTGTLSIQVSPLAAGSRANAFAVRCVKER